METSKELKDCIERIKENSNGSWEDMLTDLFAELQQNPHWLFEDMGDAEEVLKEWEVGYGMVLMTQSKVIAIQAMRQYAAQEIAKFYDKEANKFLVSKEAELAHENANLKQRVMKLEDGKAKSFTEGYNYCKKYYQIID
jgi:hypothetical protein